MNKGIFKAEKKLLPPTFSCGFELERFRTKSSIMPSDCMAKQYDFSDAHS